MSATCDFLGLHAPWCSECHNPMRPAVVVDYSKPPTTHMMIWECETQHKQGVTQ